MKKICLLFLILATTKNAFTQTTQEEYNYVIKGYKAQIESGLDMKKGYELNDIDHVPQKAQNGSIIREAWLKTLNKVPQNGTKTIAAYMIIYQRAGGEKQYFCVPSPNSSQQLTDAFFSSLSTGVLEGSEKLQLIAFILTRSLKW